MTLTAAFNIAEASYFSGAFSDILGVCFSCLWTVGTWTGLHRWFGANFYTSHPVWQKQVGELTVLASRLGGLLMGLGLAGLLSSNSFLLEDREKQKRVRSEPTVSLFRSAPSVCI